MIFSLQDGRHRGGAGGRHLLQLLAPAGRQERPGGQASHLQREGGLGPSCQNAQHGGS